MDLFCCGTLKLCDVFTKVFAASQSIVSRDRSFDLWAIRIQFFIPITIVYNVAICRLIISIEPLLFTRFDGGWIICFWPPLYWLFRIRFNFEEGLVEGAHSSHLAVRFASLLIVRYELVHFEDRTWSKCLKNSFSWMSEMSETQKLKQRTTTELFFLILNFYLIFSGPKNKILFILDSRFVWNSNLNWILMSRQWWCQK